MRAGFRYALGPRRSGLLHTRIAAGSLFVEPVEEYGSPAARHNEQSGCFRLLIWTAGGGCPQAATWGRIRRLSRRSRSREQRLDGAQVLLQSLLVVHVGRRLQPRSPPRKTGRPCPHQAPRARCAITRSAVSKTQVAGRRRSAPPRSAIKAGRPSHGAPHPAISSAKERSAATGSQRQPTAAIQLKSPPSPGPASRDRRRTPTSPRRSPR